MPYAIFMDFLEHISISLPRQPFSLTLSAWSKVGQQRRHDILLKNRLLWAFTVLYYLKSFLQQHDGACIWNAFESMKAATLALIF